jgi:hypothetical protein
MPELNQLHFGYQAFPQVTTLSWPQRFAQPRQMMQATNAHHFHLTFPLTLASSTMELLHEKGVSLSSAHQVAITPHQAQKVDVAQKTPRPQVLRHTNLTRVQQPKLSISKA